MARFSVPVVAIKGLEPIPGADRIELAVVEGYRSVVVRGQFAPGDLAVYIPEGSIVPDVILTELGLVGKLAGPAGNRVKAVRLRGCLSQGILYRLARPPFAWEVHENVSEALGITKWVPAVPAGMNGTAVGLPGHTLNFDVDDYKRYPDVLQLGEQVAITEKLHGTCCPVGYIPGAENPDLLQGDGFVTSKGLGASGLVFAATPENLARNIYIRIVEQEGILTKIRAQAALSYPGMQVVVLGEVFGSKVQDLTYGNLPTTFRAFDVFVGMPGTPEARYLDHAEQLSFLAGAGITRVPELGVFSFTPELFERLSQGKETASGQEAHMREGIVIVPVTERRDTLIGRVKLKYLNPDYLTRKGEVTEYN
jgi:RNA ligase (TIGR02306 family)